MMDMGVSLVGLKDAIRYYRLRENPIRDFILWERLWGYVSPEILKNLRQTLEEYCDED